MKAPRNVVLIAGPTASGKSALALRLAEAAGGEIINADAIQLYRDLHILSARPTAEEEARVPHHLFALADAADGWSVGRWLQRATAAIEDILSRGRLPVVVGGTGLYFRALTEGLAEMPPSQAASRAEATALFNRIGEAAFRQALAGVDPRAEARIAPGDRQRLTRAHEVHALSGRSLSDWQDATAPSLAPGSWVGVVLEPPRGVLYARCDTRFEAMVADGALTEASRLAARRLDPDLPVMKATGLRELAAHLVGGLSLPEAVRLGQQETRRYAKRQSTWFRNQTSDWQRVTADEAGGQWRELTALEPFRDLAASA